MQIGQSTGELNCPEVRPEDWKKGEGDASLPFVLVRRQLILGGKSFEEGIEGGKQLRAKLDGGKAPRVVLLVAGARQFLQNLDLIFMEFLGRDAVGHPLAKDVGRLRGDELI